VGVTPKRPDDAKFARPWSDLWGRLLVTVLAAVKRRGCLGVVSRRCLMSAGNLCMMRARLMLAGCRVHRGCLMVLGGILAFLGRMVVLFLDFLGHNDFARLEIDRES